MGHLFPATSRNGSASSHDSHAEPSHWAIVSPALASSASLFLMTINETLLRLKVGATWRTEEIGSGFRTSVFSVNSIYQLLIFFLNKQTYINSSGYCPGIQVASSHRRQTKVWPAILLVYPSSRLLFRLGISWHSPWPDGRTITKETQWKI
jgi:hypothetical protein